MVGLQSCACTRCSSHEAHIVFELWLAHGPITFIKCRSIYDVELAFVTWHSHGAFCLKLQAVWIIRLRELVANRALYMKNLVSMGVYSLDLVLAQIHGNLGFFWSSLWPGNNRTLLPQKRRLPSQLCIRREEGRSHKSLKGDRWQHWQLLQSFSSQLVGNIKDGPKVMVVISVNTGVFHPTWMTFWLWY